MEYLSLILFTITTCGTPGPNNTMITASGVNYGARRSVPHVVGINIGFPVMVMAVGLGFGGSCTAGWSSWTSSGRSEWRICCTSRTGSPPHRSTRTARHRASR